MRKQFFKPFLLTAILVVWILPLIAQHYVKDRPAMPPPSQTKPAKPYKECIWIKEDWKWANGTYVWYGGRWARPPYEGATWVSGHWRHNSYGWSWLAGHWRSG